MDKEIDLGMKMGKMAEPAPSSDEKMYPRFHVCGPEKLDIPESGEMEIEFKRVSETSRKNEDGSDYYECVIEVRKILETEGEEEEEDEPEAPSKRDKSAEEALDTLAEALSKKKEANGGSEGY